MKLSKKQRNEVRECVEKLLSTDFEHCICMTDEGIIVAGTKKEAVATIGILANHLKYKENFSEKEILNVVKLGMSSEYSRLMGKNQYSKEDTEFETDWDESGIQKMLTEALEEALKEIKKMTNEERKK